MKLNFPTGWLYHLTPTTNGIRYSQWGINKNKITRITVEFTKLNFKLELTIYCCVHTIPEIDEKVLKDLYYILTKKFIEKIMIRSDYAKNIKQKEQGSNKKILTKSFSN